MVHLKTKEELKSIRLRRLARRLHADVRRLDGIERDKKFRQELKEDRVWEQAHRNSSAVARAVIEAHIKRKLRRGEVVHHIDYDHSNNAIENLRLMTNTAHSRFHSRKEERLRARKLKTQFYKEWMSTRRRPESASDG